MFYFSGGEILDSDAVTSFLYELYSRREYIPKEINPAQILSPEDALLPLAQMDPAVASGMHGGQQYGIALWYNPLVFSVPDGWFENRDGEIQPETSGKAYFTLATPAPEKPAYCGKGG